MTAIEQLEAAWRSVGFDTRLDEFDHGDLPRWRRALETLPAARQVSNVPGNVVAVTGTLADHAALEHSIRALIPWRKGPFELFGIGIDSEWQSDRKWQRITHAVDLADKRVLDVGSGNGYYGWRMLEAGAASVIGVDPTLLFVLQHALVSRYRQGSNIVLPVRLKEHQPDARFDVVFSMGVIYHQRNPNTHLHELADVIEPGGTLVLESLVARSPFVPDDRYARMRNVWGIPSEASLMRDLSHAGFVDMSAINVALTRTVEQRASAAMPFESLAAALDSANALTTVEGYPAPIRAVIIARRR